MVSVSLVLRFLVSQCDFCFKSFSALVHRNQGACIELNNFWNKTIAALSLTSTCVSTLRECSNDWPSGQAMVWASLNSMTFILPSVNWEAVLTNIYIKPISSGIDITKTNYNTTQSTKICCLVSKLNYYSISCIQ